MDGEGLLNEELPNCWECPKCYQEDSSEKTQVRELSPILHCEKEGSFKLRITFAFASLFARLFFILFCLLSFFFLWLYHGALCGLQPQQLPPFEALIAAGTVVVAGAGPRG